MDSSCPSQSKRRTCGTRPPSCSYNGAQHMISTDLDDIHFPKSVVKILWTRLKTRTRHACSSLSSLISTSSEQQLSPEINAYCTQSCNSRDELSMPDTWAHGHLELCGREINSKPHCWKITITSWICSAGNSILLRTVILTLLYEALFRLVGRSWEEL
jgi:hypothetical protein